MPLGGEFLVNAYTTGQQGWSRVDVSDDGFVVVWESRQFPNPLEEVHAQRYTFSGSPVGGEFRIDDRAGRKRLADVSSNRNGSFLAAWHHDEGPAPVPDPNIHARQFDAAGQPRGPQFMVNTTTAGTQSWTAVAGDGNGRYAVIWGNSSGAPGTVYGQVLAGGVSVGSEFVVTSVTIGQMWPSVAMSRTGDFVIAYGRPDGSGNGVFARRYDPSGVPRGTEFQVNTYTTGTQEFPEVAMDLAGNFVVVWSGAGNGDGFGIFGQRFDAAGNPRGGEFSVNTAVGREEVRPTVAADAAGNLLVAWESDAGDTFDDVRARRFGGLRPAALGAARTRRSCGWY
jgi:hypothetical protein